MVLIKDSLENGSTIKFDIDSRGNCIMASAILLSERFLENAFCNSIFQTKRNPRANADRFTNIPKNKQKRKAN
jgi:hypothetical protein